MQTPDSIAQALASLLDKASAIKDLKGRSLGPAMAYDTTLIAAGAAEEIKRHWRSAPEKFLKCPVAGRDRAQVLVGSLNPSLEVLEVFDQYGQRLQMENLMLLPLGSHPLRLALLPRPVEYWNKNKNEDDESSLSTRLDDYGTPVSRLTMAATWCDRPAVEALLAQPGGGVEEGEYPGSPAQALLLGTAMGALHAARKGRLPEFLPDLSAWWSQALAAGADPSKVAWPTIPLAQNLPSKNFDPWWASPWGEGGFPSHEKRAGRPAWGRRQKPVCALAVLNRALHVACIQAVRSGDSEAVRALSGQESSVSVLRAMLLSTSKGSVAFTETLLTMPMPDALEALVTLWPGMPATWDLSVEGPEGWDPVACLIERWGNVDNPSGRSASCTLIQVFLDQHALTGNALPSVSEGQFSKWRELLAKTILSHGASPSSAGDPAWAHWLGQMARQPTWMGLNQSQAEQWKKLCNLYAQAWQRAPGDQLGRSELLMDLKLVPDSVSTISQSRPQSRL